MRKRGNMLRDNVKNKYNKYICVKYNSFINSICSITIFALLLSVDTYDISVSFSLTVFFILNPNIVGTAFGYNFHLCSALCSHISTLKCTSHNITLF